MTGILCLDKPENMTSFLAVRRVRGILGLKKAGHTGTLDPMATGVLPIALSGATRFISLLPTHKKTYEARVELGKTTDTLDITGTVLSESAVSVSPEEIKEAAASFLGESKQLPPMYSAKLKDGVRLYDLARQGIEIERETQDITIYALEVFDITENSFSMTVTCSAGTYIRSLASDIGEKLGCGAVLTALRRTEANGFALPQSVTLEELEKLRDEHRLDECILSLDACLSSYPALTVTEAQAVRFHNGGDLMRDRVKGLSDAGLYRVYAPDGAFLGLGELLEDGDSLLVKRVYVCDE